MNEAQHSPDGAVHLAVAGPIARIVFDRPHAHNAMTWSMYERLETICRELRDNRDIRVVAFSGAGGKAFIAGADIAQFRAFKSGDDGVAYEQHVVQFLRAVEALPMPTVAVIDGWCVGGGLAIATMCDLRIATPSARFGVPIARTLGNCLAAGVYARLIAEFGIGRTKRMLMLAEMLGAEEAREAGYVSLIVEPADLPARVDSILAQIAGQAPITMQVGKEAMRRLLSAVTVEDEDLIRRAYGSEDFKEGVDAFVAKRKPQWRGR